ncbi:hypothetical protein CK203_110339 [Vitis vinifera]|uniref:Uncharacterized protein n=1 Tax=Vitis vinifera TaxID=29760 RepID=A0A438D0H8_VITVI|nr:hypothetical protein CK203_110339 [Vitis vinifera]
MGYGYASGCALMLPLLYSRYHIARTLNLGSSEEAEKLFGVVRFFKMTLSCFFLVWLVLGIVWIPGALFSIRDDATLLETLCLVLFLSGCFVSHPESINELPTYKFKSKENGRGEGGVWAAGTIKERTLSEEDAVSSMISFMALQLVAKPTSGHGTESGFVAFAWDNMRTMKSCGSCHAAAIFPCGVCGSMAEDQSMLSSLSI